MDSRNYTEKFENTASQEQAVALVSLHGFDIVSAVTSGFFRIMRHKGIDQIELTIKVDLTGGVYTFSRSAFTIRPSHLPVAPDFADTRDESVDIWMARSGILTPRQPTLNGAIHTIAAAWMSEVDIQPGSGNVRPNSNLVFLLSANTNNILITVNGEKVSEARILEDYIDLMARSLFVDPVSAIH